MGLRFGERGRRGLLWPWIGVAIRMAFFGQCHKPLLRHVGQGFPSGLCMCGAVILHLLWDIQPRSPRCSGLPSWLQVILEAIFLCNLGYFSSSRLTTRGRMCMWLVGCMWLLLEYVRCSVCVRLFVCSCLPVRVYLRIHVYVRSYLCFPFSNLLREREKNVRKTHTHTQRHQSAPSSN